MTDETPAGQTIRTALILVAIALLAVGSVSIRHTESLFLPQPLPAFQSLSDQEIATHPAVFRKTIHINTAHLEELLDLDGIGAARAQKILDNRPYNSTKDLVQKTGIPNKIIQGFADELVF